LYSVHLLHLLCVCVFFDPVRVPLIFRLPGGDDENKRGIREKKNENKRKRLEILLDCTQLLLTLDASSQESAEAISEGLRRAFTLHSDQMGSFCINHCLNHNNKSPRCVYLNLSFHSMSSN
ncbi:hypothetical protein SK128_018891, partial [Halocaridina rubra]